MSEDSQEERRNPVPSFITSRVRKFLDACEVMEKLRFRGLIVLAVLVPLFIWVQSDDVFLMAFESGGVWGFLWLAWTFANFEFRHIRSASLAKKIDTHVPPGHESREDVIVWIARRREGSSKGRDALLAKLGSPVGTALRFAGSVRTERGEPADAPRSGESTAAMIDRRFSDILARFGVRATGSRPQTQTQTHTYSTTQVFRNGKWETVYESSGDDALQDPPEEVIQEALERLDGEDGEEVELEAPEGFEAIPVSPAEDPLTERKRKRRKRRWGRRRHMPLEIDQYEPDDTETGPDARSGE